MVVSWEFVCEHGTSKGDYFALASAFTRIEYSSPVGTCKFWNRYPYSDFGVLQGNAWLAPTARGHLPRKVGGTK